MPRLATAIVAVLLASGLAGCNEDVIITAFPVMEVGIDRIEFGAVPVGRTSTREVVIQNSGANALSLAEPSVWENPAGAFRAGEYDRVIEPGTQGVMEVVFVPPDIQRYESILAIKGNDPENQVVQVQLGGDGFRQGAIEVEPLHIDFGMVDAGSVGLDTVYIRNVGNGDLCVTHVDLTESTKTSFPDYEVLNSFDDPSCTDGIIHEGKEKTIRVLYHPGPDSVPPGDGFLQVLAADPFQPETRVRLTARVNRAPVADAGPDQEVDPLTAVTLDGSQSFDPDGHEPLSYEWALVRRPEGSGAAILDPQAEMPGFVPDLVGVYEAELWVTDSTGLRSLLPDRVVVTAVPAERLLVELVWDSPIADLDLHMLHPGGSLGGFLDCYYGNRNPDWGEAGPGDDPALLRDDLMGFGPETIGYAEPLEITYTLKIDFFAAHTPSGREPTSATLRIFIDGLLRAEIVKKLSEQGQLWTAATVQWPEGAITELDQVE
jgi:hypothetical protein